MREDKPGEAPAGGVTGQREERFFAAAQASKRKMLKVEMGYVGRFVGAGSQQAGNIAFFAIVATFVVLVVLAFAINVATNADTFLKLASILVSIITLSLGYLFGVHQHPPTDGSN